MEKIKALKFAVVAFVVALVSSLTVSCGSDDDVATATYTLNVVYSGGGKTNAELEEYNKKSSEIMKSNQVETDDESKAKKWFETFVAQLESKSTTMASNLYSDGFRGDVTLECQLLKGNSVISTKKLTMTAAK